MQQIAITNAPTDTATRRLAEIAKQTNERDWELHDLLKRKRLETRLLHHTTDHIMDLIHELNGVPKEGENGFTRDNWDDDFLEYFNDVISLDECMLRYSNKLSTLNQWRRSG